MNSVYGAWRTRVQAGLATLALTGGLCFAGIPGPASAVQPTQAHPQPTRTVLVLGDSLSAGYGLAANQGWVPLTAVRMRKTHPGWRVVNASISGETTAGGASRIASELARNRPSVVIVELGANDGLRGLQTKQTRDNLELIVSASKKSGAKVLLLGMRMPPNFGATYTRAFEKNFSDLAKTHGTAFVPFFLQPIAGERSAFQADHLHPVAAAQPRLRDHVWKALAPLLK